MSVAVSVAFLLARLILGLGLAAHGTQKLFGWFGGQGLAGTGGFFEGLGFRPGRLFALMAGLGRNGGRPAHRARLGRRARSGAHRARNARRDWVGTLPQGFLREQRRMGAQRDGRCRRNRHRLCRKRHLRARQLRWISTSYRRRPDLLRTGRRRHRRGTQSARAATNVLTVAFYGAGMLGSAMVRGMLKRGIDVRVWNRTFDKAQALEEYGARAVADPAEPRAAPSDPLCLHDDASVDAVLEAALAGVAPENAIVDHTTVLPQRVAERASGSPTQVTLFFMRRSLWDRHGGGSDRRDDRLGRSGACGASASEP